MSKINIKAKTKSKEENHEFKGKAIKNGSSISYIDGEVKTKIILDDTIKIIRIKDYLIELNFKENSILKGKYKTPFGYFDLETETLNREKSANKIKIKYKLIIDKQIIDTFEYILDFSIDSL